MSEGRHRNEYHGGLHGAWSYLTIGTLSPDLFASLTTLHLHRLHHHHNHHHHQYLTILCPNLNVKHFFTNSKAQFCKDRGIDLFCSCNQTVERVAVTSETLSVGRSPSQSRCLGQSSWVRTCLCQPSQKGVKKLGLGGHSGPFRGGRGGFWGGWRGERGL